MSYETSPETRAALTGPVELELRSPILDAMLGEEEHGWRGLRETLVRADLARAARPPDVHVTVSGIPGQFHLAGSSAQLAWSPPPGERT